MKTIFKLIQTDRNTLKDLYLYSYSICNYQIDLLHLKMDYYRPFILIMHCALIDIFPRVSRLSWARSWRRGGPVPIGRLCGRSRREWPADLRSMPNQLPPGRYSSVYRAQEETVSRTQRLFRQTDRLRRLPVPQTPAGGSVPEVWARGGWDPGHASRGGGGETTDARQRNLPQAGGRPNR